MASIVRNLATVGMTPCETTVFKATYNDQERPKDKHVKRILDIVQHQRRSVRSPMEWDVIGYVQARVRGARQWPVVLKSFIVIHRLMRDGHESVYAKLRRRESMLSVSATLDTSTAHGWGQSKFCQRYGFYLLEKMRNTIDLGVSIERQVAERGSAFLATVAAEDIFKLVPRLEKQFQRFLDCDIVVVDHTVAAPGIVPGRLHPIASAAWILLVKDAFRLYAALIICIQTALETFEEGDAERAQWTLDVYRAFVALNARFKTWGEKAVSALLIRQDMLPGFDSFPQSLIDSLTRHVEHLEARGSELEDAPTGSVRQLSDALGGAPLKLVVESGGGNAAQDDASGDDPRSPEFAFDDSDGDDADTTEKYADPAEELAAFFQTPEVGVGAPADAFGFGFPAGGFEPAPVGSGGSGSGFLDATSAVAPDDVAVAPSASDAALFDLAPQLGVGARPVPGAAAASAASAADPTYVTTLSGKVVRRAQGAQGSNGAPSSSATGSGATSKRSEKQRDAALAEFAAGLGVPQKKKAGGDPFADLGVL